MKKLILTLAFLGFVAFGALSIQSLVAASTTIEIVNFDKDPKKDGENKSVETKEAKASTKSADGCCAKGASASCGDKSATASADCCDKSKGDCAKACPDKK